MRPPQAGPSEKKTCIPASIQTFKAIVYENVKSNFYVYDIYHIKKLIRITE